ncbi:hypothetical protein [Pontibacter harenae]|uniref:hypothetical protein n=1 Tax=Pontibacter harenae TaxID=2894083 RepID=UPI001E3CD236|nr:hypothetical protein [Pontibacter harenae]MCC9168679.1 hypothetical protein [Pontibacter harenae]
MRIEDVKMRFKLLLLLFFSLCVKQGMASDPDSLAQANLLKQLKLTPLSSSAAEKELLIFLGRSITNQGKVLHLQKAGDKWSGKLYTY